jgi:hypothetical protein
LTIIVACPFETVRHEGLTPLPAIDLALNDLKDIIVSFFRMRDDAVGTVLDAVLQNERAAAIEQIERAPAEKAGPPFVEVVTGIEGAVLVGKELVVHVVTPPSGCVAVPG